MDKVARKSKKTIRHKRWFLLIAVLLLTCVGLLSRQVKDNPAELPVEEYFPPQNETVYVVNIPQEQIVSLSVYPRDYTDYALIRTDEGMRLQQNTSVPLREDVVDSILYAAGCMPVNLTIGPAEEMETDAFGFAAPSLRYEITDTQGNTVEVLLGDVVPETEVEQYYCLANGMIYTVLAEPSDVLYHHEEYLRDFRQPRLQADLIDRIDVQGDVTLTLYYTPDGFLMEKPEVYPVQQAKMDVVLTYIERMAFEAYLGTPEEVDLEALGLAQPRITVRISQAPSVISGITAEGEIASFDVDPREYTLQLGHDTGRSGVYVCWEGNVYKASNFLFGFWAELKPEEFYTRTPMNFPIDKLQSITVETSAETAVYDVEMVEVVTENNQIATDEFGQTLYDVQISKNGHPMEAKAFTDWYIALNKMAVSGLWTEETAGAGEVLATLTFNTENTQRRVVFRACDALHALVEVDGTALFYVEKASLTLLDYLP